METFVLLFRTAATNFVYPLVVLVALCGGNSAGAQNLSEIADLALQNDPNLKKAEAERSAREEFRTQSLARFFPSASALGESSLEFLHNKKAKGFTGFGSGDFRGPQVNQEYWSHTFDLNVTQPVFHWDHWVQLSQSENVIAQAEANYRAELQNLLTKTTQAYFDVLSARDNLEFAMAEKEAITRQLEQAKQRFEVGIAAITDVNEAQAAFDQALAGEIEAANRLDNQNEALKEIVGERELVLDLLGEQLPLKKPEPADISKWSETAELNNFEVIAAYNEAESARKSIEIQRSGHLPQLDIVGAYGVSDVNSSFGFRGDTQNIGLRLNVPLFEGGMVNSKTRQAQFEFEAAKENLSAVRRSIVRQVKDAYRGVITNISRVEALKTAVISSETSLEASEAGLSVGTRTMVDVLNVQRDLYKAKRDYARARYDYLINSIKLKQLASNLTADDLDRISRLLLPGEKAVDKTLP
ncbi:TolC family outer membrane protein [Candidatus Methylomicrobium oryzae]|jgi:outer membrane protein|uniref:TolC family outer membrane protein n=1 Tax=Candidatus Methylomicrobium oryzae TaxID=2802053 RepID=UPI001923FFFE|nr:TolC family outer membrane protein [Methylomicrobium sp. RS1]MBL1264092.1 TolC family outer membrane protein [Methylomicrobium sp. RS1]